MIPVVVIAGRGLNHDHKTLDVPERQVLIKMDDEPQRYWQHLLLHRVQGSEWITCDPAGDVVVENLGGEEVVPLMRLSEFPQGGRPILAFPTLDDVMLASVRARAATLAEVHGIQLGSPGESAATMWVHADTCHPLFGNEVPSTVVADPARTHLGGSVGIALVDSHDGKGAAWTHIQRLLRTDLPKWKSEKREGAGRDPRLSSLHTPSSATTRPMFREALSACSSAQTPEPSVFTGPAAFPELATALCRSGMEPQAFVANYLQTSGVHAKSAVAIEFSHLMFAIYAFTVLDRLDPYQSTTVEHLARRVLQLQKAIKRNPKAPDFEGLSEYTRHCSDAVHALTTPEFDKHVAEKQKQDSWIMKNQRLQREESEQCEKNRQTRKRGKNDGVKEEPG